MGDDDVDDDTAARRKAFFEEYVEPMVTEAKEIDIPMTELMVYLIQLGEDDEDTE